MSTLVLAKERSVIARCVIEILKAWARAYDGSPDMRDHSTDLIIGAAVMIGEEAGSPMTASDISEYIGIPRATVVRRVRSLEKQGYMIVEKRGNRSPVRLANPNNPKVISEVRKLLTTLRKLSAEVSDLDSARAGA